MLTTAEPWCAVPNRVRVKLVNVSHSFLVQAPGTVETRLPYVTPMAPKI